MSLSGRNIRYGFSRLLCLARRTGEATRGAGEPVWGTRAAPPAPRMVAAVYGCDGPVLTMHNHRKILDEVVRLSGVGCQIDAERVGRQSRRGSYFGGIVGYVDGARRAHADLSLARCA